jgi:hypothetical protein
MARMAAVGRLPRPSITSSTHGVALSSSGRNCCPTPAARRSLATHHHVGTHPRRPGVGSATTTPSGSRRKAHVARSQASYEGIHEAQSFRWTRRYPNHQWQRSPRLSTSSTSPASSASSASAMPPPPPKIHGEAPPPQQGGGGGGGDEEEGSMVWTAVFSALIVGAIGFTVWQEVDGHETQELQREMNRRRAEERERREREEMEEMELQQQNKSQAANER